jgi:hypothetical protein
MATDHATRLGKLVGNLQSLETVLRFFLDKALASISPRLPEGKTYFGLRAGEEVPVNAFTNFDFLSDLIAKYNAIVQAKDQALLVDASVVAVRDLLAHGRIAADSPDEARLVIIKFDRPKNGSVRVTDSAMMTDDWCQERIDLVRAQIEKVGRARETIAV